MSKRRLPIAGTITPPAVLEAAEATVTEMLGEGPPVGVAPAIAESALSWLDELTERLAEQIPRGQVDCQAGCSYCCHVKVLCTPIEAIAVLRALEASLSAEERARLLERVVEIDDRTRGKDRDERAHQKLACPLLVDGQCSVYTSRPLHCAGANSYDRNTCKRGFENPDQDIGIALYVPQLQLADMLVASISNALGPRGIDFRMLELNAALRVLLETPDVEERWARGEAVFEPAADPEFAAAMQASKRS